MKAITGESLGEFFLEMRDLIDEYFGEEDAAAGATPGATPKKRGRKSAAQKAAEAASGANGATAGAPVARIWNVCAFHAQMVAKAGQKSATVPPHECEGCKVMASGQDFAAVLGGGASAPTIAAAGAVPAPATPADPARPPTGTTLENIKQLMRELVNGAVKAKGAKTDAEVEAACKPISDWLATNFKAANGQPAQAASDVQVTDYPRFVELALKFAGEIVPAKRDLFA